MKSNRKNRYQNRAALLYGLKIVVFNDSELGNMALFKLILDFGLKIWLFDDYE